jgi:hypothetical protein
MSDIEWRPIPGWEGFYEASDHGDVRSLPRRDRLGRKAGGQLLAKTERGGYLQVSLRRKTEGERACMTVHKAVMLAFAGPRPSGHDIRHLDGNPLNNRRANLAYGTRRENNLDAVRHGTNLNAAKTHCLRGHELTDDNIYLFRTSRACRRCRSIYRQRYEDKKVAA